MGFYCKKKIGVLIFCYFNCIYSVYLYPLSEVNCYIPFSEVISNKIIAILKFKIAILTKLVLFRVTVINPLSTSFTLILQNGPIRKLCIQPLFPKIRFKNHYTLVVNCYIIISLTVTSELMQPLFRCRKGD